MKKKNDTPKKERVGFNNTLKIDYDKLSDPQYDPMRKDKTTPVFIEDEEVNKRIDEAITRKMKERFGPLGGTNRITRVIIGGCDGEERQDTPDIKQPIPTSTKSKHKGRPKGSKNRSHK